MKEKKNNNSFINLGCRLNIFEGEVIKSLVKKNNISNFTIINSCSVTQEAEKKVKYEIRKSKKNLPNNKIIVTGCAAQINPKKYSNIEEVDFVIGNKEDYDWFLDLRRYGSVQHSGFGMGIERVVAWICGLTHIRETIPFARTMSRLNP